MAVAGVGVAMGPRNRRRLTTAAVALGAIAAIAVLVVWRGGGTALVRSTSQSSGMRVPAHLTLLPDKLTYGMSTQQVLRRIGKPERIAGSCWQYRENVKDFAGQTINAVRVCFFSNAYSSNYVEIDGKWRDPTSTTRVIAPPTQ